MAGPVDTDNFFEWDCLLTGPEGTSFAYGLFPAKFFFDSVSFSFIVGVCTSLSALFPGLPVKSQNEVHSIFHPNIYADGGVCISMLHTGGDPTGYETSAEQWSPVQSVEEILVSVLNLLAEPNPESPANLCAAKMLREDPEQFEKIAKNAARKSLGRPKLSWARRTEHENISHCISVDFTLCLLLLSKLE